MPAAATKLPSGETAMAITGVGDASTSATVFATWQQEIDLSIGARGNDFPVGRNRHRVSGVGRLRTISPPFLMGQIRIVAS